MRALARRALSGVVKFSIALAALIFVPAWTIDYWQAWTYWGVFSAAVTAITLFFLRRDPALIERRLDAGPAAETDPAQRRIQTVASVLLVAVFVVAGLDHRGEWATVADSRFELAGDLLVALGFGVIFLVFRANTHASATVQVGGDQRVITSGPYAVVRHPMYSGAVLLFLATPLALGSLWAYVPAVLLCGAVVARLLREERYLSSHLPGYDNYRRSVKVRLLPGIW